MLVGLGRDDLVLGVFDADASHLITRPPPGRSYVALATGLFANEVRTLVLTHTGTAFATKLPEASEDEWQWFTTKVAVGLPSDDAMSNG